MITTSTGWTAGSAQFPLHMVAGFALASVLALGVHAARAN